MNISLHPRRVKITGIVSFKLHISSIYSKITGQKKYQHNDMLINDVMLYYTDHNNRHTSYSTIYGNTEPTIFVGQQLLSKCITGILKSTCNHARACGKIFKESLFFYTIFLYLLLRFTSTLSQYLLCYIFVNTQRILCCILR